MTVEKLLQKYQSGQTAETPADPESVEDQGAYGIIRATRERALMLELRKKDGSVLAIPYSLIEQLKFSPVDGVTIHACGREIRINGRNLNPPPSARLGLFNGICRHRVAWVAEYSRSAVSGEIDAVTQVEIVAF